MIQIAVTCAKATATTSPECPQPMIPWEIDALPLLPHDLMKFLGEHGWVQEDGDFYCPRHWPADAGIMWDPPIPDGEYHPIASTGWEARTLMGSNRLELRPISIETADGVAA